MTLLWMVGVSDFIETISVGMPCSDHIRTQVSAIYAPAVRAQRQKIQKAPGSPSPGSSQKRFHFARQGITR